MSLPCRYLLSMTFVFPRPSDVSYITYEETSGYYNTFYFSFTELKKNHIQHLNKKCREIRVYIEYKEKVVDVCVRNPKMNYLKKMLPRFCKGTKLNE